MGNQIGIKHPKVRPHREESFGKEAIKEMGDVKKMAGEIDSNESQNLASEFKKHSKPANNHDL